MGKHGIVEWNCIQLPLIKNDLEYPELWLKLAKSLKILKFTCADLLFSVSLQLEGPKIY